MYKHKCPQSFLIDVVIHSVYVDSTDEHTGGDSKIIEFDLKIEKERRTVVLQEFQGGGTENAMEVLNVNSRNTTIISFLAGGNCSNSCVRRFSDPGYRYPSRVKI